MAALLGQLARRIGGSVLQRTQAAVTSPAVAEERRRQLVPRRRMYRTDEGAAEDGAAKWEQKRLRFKRIDSEFTATLNGVAGMYLVYALLTCNPDRGKVEEEAQSNEEQEE